MEIGKNLGLLTFNDPKIQEKCTTKGKKYNCSLENLSEYLNSDTLDPELRVIIGNQKKQGKLFSLPYEELLAWLKNVKRQEINPVTFKFDFDVQNFNMMLQQTTLIKNVKQFIEFLKQSGYQKKSLFNFLLKKR